MNQCSDISFILHFVPLPATMSTPKGWIRQLIDENEVQCRLTGRSNFLGNVQWSYAVVAVTKR